jgi:catalase
MNEDQKMQLTQNVAARLSHANASIQENFLGYLYKADADYAQRVKALCAGPAA